MYPGAFSPTGARRSGGDELRNPATRTWVADPPPFGAASDRFPAPPRTASPDYHVAYRDVTQPPRWTAKGWVGIDDFVKPHRGTAPSVYGSSSLMPPSAPPRHSAGLAPLAPPCPNEVRLQELLALQRRKVATEPGPGAYEPRDVSHLPRRFRRAADPSVDGPFLPESLLDGATTRSKEIAALIRTQGDSGLGPGDYEAAVTKDLLMRSSVMHKVPVTDREGRAQHAKTLSISRSIQHGIDWHVPIVVEPPPPPRALSAPTAPTPPPPQPPSAATAAGDSDAGGAAARSAPTTARSHVALSSVDITVGPSAVERPLSHHSTSVSGGGAAAVGAGGGGSGSREASPSGRPSAAEALMGAPPAPPAQVSRAVRRQHQRRPGDWDWDRLGKNYRTGWTTLHGGAYTQGDHPSPRRSSAPAATLVGPLSPQSSTPTSAQAQPALAPAQPPPPPPQQQQLPPQRQQRSQSLPAPRKPPSPQPPPDQGIYPIQEESSGALASHASTTAAGAVPHGGRSAQPSPSLSSSHSQSPIPSAVALLELTAQHSKTRLASMASQHSAAAADASVGLASAFGVGMGGGIGAEPKLKELVSGEDLRRRAEAQQAAAKAQQVSHRMSDWHAKFAG